MNKCSKNEAGFGLLEMVLAIAAIVIVVGVGSVVYKHDHKSAKPATVSSHTNTSTNSADKTLVSPYVGWKTYCDTANNDCFQYPPSWSLGTDNVGGVAASLKAPDNTVMVSYQNPFSKQNDLSAFYTTGLGSTSEASDKLEVVGGFFTSNYTPLYTVVDSSLVSSDLLAVGQTNDFQFTAGYTNQNSPTTAQLYAIPIGTSITYTGASEAQAWFDTADAKTSLLILRSFYFR